jgi:hypothetical protein
VKKKTYEQKLMSVALAARDFYEWTIATPFAINAAGAQLKLRDALRVAEIDVPDPDPVDFGMPDD